MQKTALEHDLQKLVEKALALGASGAKTVDVASIRTGAWTRWKCQFGCPNYGKTLCCPPFVPDYAATQRFLQEFIRGIIIQYTFPLNGVTVENFAAADLSMSNGLLEILLNLVSNPAIPSKIFPPEASTGNPLSMSTDALSYSNPILGAIFAFLPRLNL